MMAGGYAACQPARKKTAGSRLRGKDPRRASRRSPSFSPLTLMAYIYSVFPFLSEAVMS